MTYTGKQILVLILALCVLASAGCHSNSIEEQTQPFLDAVKGGDVLRAQTLLKQNPQLLAEVASFDGSHGGLALNIAIRDAPVTSRLAMVQLLLNAVADPDFYLRSMAESSFLIIGPRVQADPEQNGEAQIAELFLKAGVHQEIKDWALLNLQETIARSIASKKGATPVELKDIENQLKGLKALDAVLRKYGAGSDLDSPLWRLPPNLSAVRLTEYQHSFDCKVVWHSPEGPMLVVIRGGFMGMPHYEVLVVDRTLTLKRFGVVDPLGGGPSNPYALIEVRSQSQNLPEKLRGRWLLGVAWWNPRFDASKPIRFTGGSEIDAGVQNLMSCTLIDWIGDEPDDVAAVSQADFSHKPSMMPDLPDEPGFRHVHPRAWNFDINVLADRQIRCAEPSPPAGFQFDHPSKDSGSAKTQ